MNQPPGTAPHSNLKVVTIRRTTKLHRISLPDYPSPLFFNPNQSGRYNSPAGEYGVCYVADSVDTALSETLGHSVAARYAPSERKVIAEGDLEAYHVYQVEVKATLHLGKFYESGLPRLNLDGSINTSSKPYSIPQQWSLWVHNHPDVLDGIGYHSRHLTGTRCEALFERCASKLMMQDLGPLIDWACPKTNKDIWDLLLDHGWVIA